MQLYNTLSAKERATLIQEAGQERLTISFYQYAHIGNPGIFRNHLFIRWNQLDVLGRIYVAHEGINAQLSVPAGKFEAFKKHLDSISFLENVRLNIALEQDNLSFLKLKVKVRPKIVADGLQDDSFDVTDKGIHVDAEQFNALIDDPDTVLVDMRNHYESEIGHFRNAITPDVDTFRDSLDIIEKDLADHKEDKKLVMYCTGGIR
ncbi:MAG: rhodanese-like domain-containing protein, partial [Pricia sp.]